MERKNNSFVFGKIHYFIGFLIAVLLEIGILFVAGNLF